MPISIKSRLPAVVRSRDGGEVIVHEATERIAKAPSTREVEVTEVARSDHMPSRETRVEPSGLRRVA